MADPKQFYPKNIAKSSENNVAQAGLYDTTQALQNIKKGTGKFLGGEVYEQDLGKLGKRQVLVSGTDAQGNIQGWYMPNSQEAKLLGQNQPYLEPATFKPKDLSIPQTTEANIKTAVNYLFGQKPKAELVAQQPLSIPEESNSNQQLFAQTIAGQMQPASKGGTTRDVYDLGNAVAKVAKDAKGLQQNKEELKDVPNTPAPLESGKDYVVTEKAQRDDKALNEFLKPLREFDSEDFEDKNPKLMKLMDEMGLSHFKKHKLLWGDFTAARNWGLDKSGQPTLLDKGTLNADIYAHDEAPQKVQKEYDKIKAQRREVRKPPLNVRTHRREVTNYGK